MTNCLTLICLILVTLAPGPAAYTIYSLIVNKNPDWAMSLYGQRTNVSIVTATFAFTMMGFLSTAMAILISFSSSTTFKDYKRRGHLDRLLFFFFYSIVALAVTFCLSLLGFARARAGIVLPFTIMSACNNIVQLLVVVLVTINMMRKASD